MPLEVRIFVFEVRSLVNEVRSAHSIRINPLVIFPLMVQLVVLASFIRQRRKKELWLY